MSSELRVVFGTIGVACVCVCMLGNFWVELAQIGDVWMLQQPQTLNPMLLLGAMRLEGQKGPEDDLDERAI